MNGRFVHMNGSLPRVTGRGFAARTTGLASTPRDHSTLPIDGLLANTTHSSVSP
jgi:hypothetical protein